jgi:hypothetical protein
MGVDDVAAAVVGRYLIYHSTSFALMMSTSRGWLEDSGEQDPRSLTLGSRPFEAVWAAQRRLRRAGQTAPT